MFQKEDFQRIIPEAPVIFSLSEILEIDILDLIKKKQAKRRIGISVIIDKYRSNLVDMTKNTRKQ